MESRWIGGKPSGCVHFRNHHCQVIFSKNTDIPSKCFSYFQYETENEAKQHAIEWNQKMSSENGLNKNMYRIVLDEHNEPYMEVKLQNNLIMKCDVGHLPLVEERIWSAFKGADKKTYYVKSRESKKRDQEYCLFHRRAFPNLKEIDHINRDGLDNRSINIREGSGKVNANNKGMQKNNVSGTKGVFYEGGPKERWRAQWVDFDGVKRTKSFACSKWGDEAFNKACEWREEQHDIKMAMLDGYIRTVENGKIVMTPVQPVSIDDIVIVDD